MSAEGPVDVIIDTDPGIDDAMAILLALACPERVRVVGLTITHGNLGGAAGLEQLERNAQHILHLAGREDIPVVLGFAQPLRRPAHGGADFVHGRDGLGNVTPHADRLPEPRGQHHPDDAARWIVQRVMQAALPLYIVALGPLTNLARALELEPQVASRVACVHIMGGAFHVPGNIGPTSEANIRNDPEAAHAVLTGFDRVVLTPLDVSTKSSFDARTTRVLAEHSPVCGGFIERIAQQYLSFYATHNSRDEADVHDSSALATLLWPDLFHAWEQTWVYVECSSPLTLGTTVGDFRHTLQHPHPERRCNVRVPMRVDNHEFMRRFVAAFARLP